jgi:hypothetical protein
MGAAEGGLPGAIEGTARGALGQKMIKGLGVLPRAQSVPLAGMAFGATTPGPIEDKLVSGLTGAGMQAMGPSGKGEPLTAREIGRSV